MKISFRKLVPTPGRPLTSFQDFRERCAIYGPTYGLLGQAHGCAYGFHCEVHTDVHKVFGAPYLKPMYKFQVCQQIRSVNEEVSTRAQKQGLCDNPCYWRSFFHHAVHIWLTKYLMRQYLLRRMTKLELTMSGMTGLHSTNFEHFHSLELKVDFSVRLAFSSQADLPRQVAQAAVFSHNTAIALQH